MRSLAAVLLVGALGVTSCGGFVPEEVDSLPEAAVPARPMLPSGEALPAHYGSVGDLAERGEFYASGGETELREHDGSHYHGYDGPLVWADEGPGSGSQGLVYGVEDGVVVSAGYLLAQDDLAAGRSFHGMTLREMDLPAVRSMTVDLKIERMRPTTSRWKP